MISRTKALFVALSIATALLVTPLSADAAGSSDTPASAPVSTGISVAEGYLRSNAYAKAESVLAKHVASNPNSADGWNLRGFAARKQGKFEEAETFYAKALSLNPKHTGALHYQGMLYLETGRPTMAQANLKQLSQACVIDCEDYESLKKAIETGQAY